VYLRDQLFAKKLSYPNASPYTSLKEGDCTVSFRAVGGSDVLLETDVNVQAGQFYSVFACDQVANLTALVVQDVFPDLDQNDALVRVAHLSPDAPAVDVFLNDVQVATSAEFKDVTDFQQIEDDTYTLQVKLAGTSDVVLEIEDLNLRPRVAYTLWVRGFVNGDPGEELDAGLLYNRIIL
jgi:hypothetical protein